MKTKSQIQEEALKAIAGKLRCSVGVSMGVGKTLIGLRHMQERYLNGDRKFLAINVSSP
jgi:superfamily II DNA or RNA helicase